MAGTKPSDLHLYFDYISPNAYLAWKQLPQLARRFGRRVVPVPVLYPALLGAHGLLGPMEVSPKAGWTKRNVLRKTRRLGASTTSSTWSAIWPAKTTWTPTP